MANFVPNHNFDRVFNTPGGMTGRYVRGLGRDVQKLAKVQVGTSSGTLKRSIKVARVQPTPRGPMVEVGSKVNHAYVHHEGSKPHIIKAQPGELLTFGRRGQTVFVKQVMHPGTKPNPYLRAPMNTVVLKQHAV